MQEELIMLHDFWFQGNNELANDEQFKRWFMGGKEFDAEVNTFYSLFPEMVAESIESTYDEIQQLPSVACVAVIALDQLPRNLFRGTAKAFSFDIQAMGLTKKLINDGIYSQMKPAEQLFTLMSYQHVESIELQNEGIKHFEGYAKQQDNEDSSRLLEYAKKHRDIVERFGRFPHRNDALLRQSTEEEMSYLDDGTERFGQ